MATTLGSWIPGATGYTGSVPSPNTAIFSTFTGDTLRMTKVGGGAFSVSSIGLAHLFTFNVPFSVTFVGTRADNSTVTQVITANNPNALTSYAFTLMNNIVKMEWHQGAGNPDVNQWDNINATNAVPEPFTMALAASGAIMGFRRMRQGKS